MEKRLKVWVYKEGDPPLVHGGPMHDIYGIERQFIIQMEDGKSHYIAGHPDEAHLFFLPISIANIISFVYRPLLTYSRHELQRLVTDYIRVVADKYPYWNRSTGADHFLLSCHDWAPDISGANPELYKNMIRALCNAHKSKTFKLIPGKLAPTDHKLAKSQKKRTKLAFFAGGSHGYIRKVLLEKWKDKDNEIEVHEYLPNKNDYFIKMGMTKFCLCPSGYEVASPRVVTAIQLGCVPVIISDNYSLPFSDALDWTKFSVHIPSKNISKIKIILQRISGGGIWCCKVELCKFGNIF